MEIMLEGFQLAMSALEALKENHFPTPLAGLPPTPVQKYNPEFCASPLLLKKDLKQMPDDNKYFISQGELFHFKNLDLSELQKTKDKNGDESGDESGDENGDESGDESSDESGDESSDENGDDSGDDSGDENIVETDMLVSDGDLNVEDIFIKVWSKGIHRAVQGMQGYTRAYTHMKRFSELKAKLSKDFLGMIDYGRSTVTVMRKIHGDAVRLFNEARPNDEAEYKSKLKKYWNLFKAFCRKVLLPLAHRGIIHQDLRPGYDCTYNILIGTTNKDPRVRMRLIDFESLCIINDYTVPDGGDDTKRYPKKTKNDALYVVLQQCVGISYAWIEQVDAKNFDFDDALAWWEKLNSKSLNVKKPKDFDDLFRVIDREVKHAKLKPPERERKQAARVTRNTATDRQSGSKRKRRRSPSETGTTTNAKSTAKKAKQDRRSSKRGKGKLSQEVTDDRTRNSARRGKEEQPSMKKRQRRQNLKSPPEITQNVAAATSDARKIGGKTNRAQQSANKSRTTENRRSPRKKVARKTER